MSALVAALLALALGSTSASAAQGMPLGSFTTAGCPENTPTWRIHYKVFDSNTAGLQSTTSTEKILAETNEFVNQVGALSDCGVRAHVDVVRAAEPYDGDATLDRTAPMDVPPGYDAVFGAVPGSSSAPGGVAEIDQVTMVNPWSMLMVHEWMHLVVGFYQHIRLGWPKDDVHGAYIRPDYQDPGIGLGVNPRWFADLMTGRIAEGDAMKGITRPEWAYFGTPRAPLHVDPLTYFEVPSERRVDIDGVRFGSVLDVAYVVLYSRGGRAVMRQRVKGPGDGTFPSWMPPLTVRAGRFRVCVESPAVDDRFIGASRCSDLTLPVRPAQDRKGRAVSRYSAPELLRSKAYRRFVMLHAPTEMRGLVVTVTFSATRCGRSCTTRVTRRVRLKLTGKRQSIQTPMALVRYPVRSATVTARPQLLGRARWPAFKKHITLP